MTRYLLAFFLSFTLFLAACDSGLSPQHAPQPDPSAPTTNDIFAPDKPDARINAPGNVTLVSYDGFEDVTVDMSIGDWKFESRAAAYFCPAGVSCPNVKDPDEFFGSSLPEHVILFSSWDTGPSGFFDYLPPLSLVFSNSFPGTSFPVIICPTSGIREIPGNLPVPIPFEDVIREYAGQCPGLPSIPTDGQLIDTDELTNLLGTPPDPTIRINQQITTPGFGTHKLHLHARNYRWDGTRNTDNETVTVKVRRPGAGFTSGPYMVNPGLTATWKVRAYLPSGVSVSSYQWYVNGSPTGGSRSGSTFTLSRGFYSDATLKLRFTSSDGFTYETTRDVTVNSAGCGQYVICPY